MTEVAAALIRGGTKFLICRRAANKRRGLLWEFVGGKLEPGETAGQALVRECREELAITVEPLDIFAEVVHEYPDMTVHLTLFNAVITQGEPQRLEHEEIKWISPAEIPQYEFCPADLTILEKITKEYVEAMNEVYEFLKKCGTYYLATLDEGGQPRVRPFGTIDIFDGALYIQTGRKKEVSAQIHREPKIELCAFDGERWLRVEANAAADDRTEAQQHMLDAYPALQGMYKVGDGNTEVFRLSDVTATFSSFTAPAKTVKF